MKTRWSVKCSLATAVLTLIVFLTAGWQAAPSDRLSLELRRDQEEVTPPKEPVQSDTFARFDRAMGQFGIVAGYFDHPLDLAVDDQENIFVLDAGNTRIQRMSNDGNYLSQFGEKGTREGQFDEPVAIAFDKSGYFYVVDSKNHRIQKFDALGKFILQWGGLGAGPGLFNQPTAIAFDNENKAYVADPSNDRIQKFSVNGVFLQEWNQFTLRMREGAKFDSVVALAFDDDRFGYLIALSGEEKVVRRYELNGDYYDSFDVNPPGDCRPTRMQVDNDNDWIYVLDVKGARVMRYSKAGAYQGELREGDGSFANPGGFFVDVGNKRLYVADTGHNKIQKFYLR